MKPKKTDKGLYKVVWKSNVFTVILVVLLILSFIKVSKEVLLRYQINKEISNLEQQLEDLDSKAAKMDELIAYLKTDEYLEKEARLKLNLSKPGEKQINLATDGQIVENEIENQGNNISKWFNYFFN